MARRGDNIHKRKDGRWEGRYKNGFRADGSARYSSVYAHSYSECKSKLTEAQSPLSRTAKKIRSEMLFADVLYKWLFANQIRLKGATEVKYINIIETHIIPAIGGVKLSMLDSSIINSFLDKQLNNGGIKCGKPLSPSYVRSMAVIIEATFNYAVMEGLCDPLRTPINKPVIPKKDLVILSQAAEDTLTQILICDSSQVAIGTLVALQAGLRIGEVCALRWSDVDFENNVIHIRHAISRVPSPNSEQKTMLILDTPKTASSLRDVPIPSPLRKVLMLAYQNKTSEYQKLKAILKSNNLPDIRFHDLRHTMATHAIKHGVDAKTLSGILGHTNASFTLDTYTHVTPDMKKNAANIVGGFLTDLLGDDNI